MAPIVIRAVSTVVTVLIAVVVAATLGTSSSGKIWTGIIIATVIAMIEWLPIWAPKHFAVARKYLDPRANMVGVWLQDVRHYGVPGGEAEGNRFAIFWLDYQGSDYGICGFAYASTGIEHSRWESVAGSLLFRKDGYAVTYQWTGTLMGYKSVDDHPGRSGFSHVDIRNGTGHAEHLGMNLILKFNVQRITPQWLIKLGMNKCKPMDLKTAEVRDRVALKYANRLTSDLLEGE